MRWALPETSPIGCCSWTVAKSSKPPRRSSFSTRPSPSVRKPSWPEFSSIDGLTETRRLARAPPFILRSPHNSPPVAADKSGRHDLKIVQAEKNMEGTVMTTRRDFVKAGTAAAATGIFFCGCGLLRGAHAQQPARQKLPVTVNGKRIKTIDVHAHCNFHEAGALLGEEGPRIQAGT